MTERDREINERVDNILGTPAEPGEAQAEAEKVYVDAELAARCFWAGYQASEHGVDGKERTQAFLGAVMNTYPEVQRHEHLIPIEDIFVRISRERGKRVE